MKNRKGFTLVELLVVMVILGIITGLSIPLIRNIQESNEKKQYSTYMDSVKYSAKLYVDSYNEDLFGHKKSGCAIIPYSWMEEKGLLKDIQVDKVSCNSSRTFVKVVKLDDKYGYAVSIGCGTKKADGTAQIETKIPEESVADMSTCSVDATTIMSFSATPNISTSLSYKKRNITIHVKSDTGINTNADIEYGFSATDSDNPTIIGGWKKLPISITGLNSQKQSILKGNAITISSSTIQTDTYTGTLYLYIKVNTLEDLSGRSWTTNPEEKSIKKLGSYVLDNTKPEFNDSTVVSSESGYNSIKPKLNLKVTDKLSSTEDLKMCISYDTDTCQKTVTAFKTYEKYSATKVLSQIQSNYDGSSHKVYVTVADPAGNYTTKTFNYDLAYQITYNANGGTGTMDPTYCNKNVDCTLRTNAFTRTGFDFLGFYTATSGGTKYETTTKLTKNITVYAQWKVHVCTITYNPNGGTFTSNASATTQTCDYSESGANCTNDMRNANGGHYSATRTGYSIVSGKEWIDGTRTFDQDKGYKATDFCPDLGTKNQSVALKVNWSINSYTLTLDANGGTACTPSRITKNYNEEWGTLCTPTKTNNTFLGWFTDATNGTEITNKTKVPDSNVTAYAHWKPNSTLSFTYTGTYRVVSGEYVDGTCAGTARSSCQITSTNYKIKFLTSGDLTPSVALSNIDAFLVGGGGGGGSSNSAPNGCNQFGGGGGGYVKTSKNISLSPSTKYTITIGSGGDRGANGGSTSAFGQTADGGQAGKKTNCGVNISVYNDGCIFINGNGGNGGSGGGGAGGHGQNAKVGDGGSNGGNGQDGTLNYWCDTYWAGLVTQKGGKGSGSTTREFGETSGDLYAGGGGGQGNSGPFNGKGGSGGGGNGGSNGTANTGGGGGGNAKGGSGVVVIRNKR